VRRTNRFLATLFTCGLISIVGLGIAQTKQPAPKPQEEPGSPALKNLIEAINSRDPGRIASFVLKNFDTNHADQDSWSTHCCEPNEVARTLDNIGRRSGGLIVESAYPHGTGITAFAKTKLKGGKLYIDLECGNTEPCRIESYQILSLSPGPQNFLPKPQADVSTEKRLETLKRAFEGASAGQLFSGTVLIARHGKVQFRGAYGEADRARHIPVSIDTPFFIASLGKLFTSVAVAQLVSEGKLSYDQPIIRYLPDYPNKVAASKITLRELLTHTSGLADIFSRQSPPTPLRRLRDYYPLFASDPLLFEPGRGQSYSNTGFLVASMIVESVSGEEFRHYLADHIFGPAGMRRTSSEEPYGRAIRYYRNNVEDPLNVDAPWISAEAFYGKLLKGPAVGPGGEYSTVEDLFRFAEALESGKLLDRTGFEMLVQQGLGCQCTSQQSKLIFAHTGGGPGVDTGLKLYVHRNAVSVFLSNYSPPFPQALMDDVDLFLGTS